MKWRPVYMKIDYAHAGIPEYIADSPRAFLALEDLTGKPFRELFGECEGRR